MIKQFLRIEHYIVMFWICIVSTTTYAQQPVSALPGLQSKGLAQVNGTEVYYEVYGEGDPIVLLHGSFQTIGMSWGQIIPELAKSRKVIALELQGHGHTPYSDRELSHLTLAKDVAEILAYLKIDNADIVGYSFGGTVAYQLAIQSPDLVKSLIIISAPYKSEGWQPEVVKALRSMKPQFLDQTPLRTEYFKTAPDTTQWHPFLTKMIAFNAKPYNLGDSNIKNIKSPVLLLMGDNDGIDKNILIHTYQLLGGCVFGDMAPMPKSQLAILPNKSHTSLMMDTQSILNTINTFLNQ